MELVRIMAVYADDNRECLVISGLRTTDGQLVGNTEMFGYAIDWDEDAKNYLKSPFTLTAIDEGSALLDWGTAWDVRTLLNIMGRRIVPGEKLVRSEGNERYEYTIKTVHKML